MLRDVMFKRKGQTRDGRSKGEEGASWRIENAEALTMLSDAFTLKSSSLHMIAAPVPSCAANLEEIRWSLWS